MGENNLSNLDCVAIDVLSSLITSKCMDDYGREEVCKNAYEWAETFIKVKKKRDVQRKNIIKSKNEKQKTTSKQKHI